MKNGRQRATNGEGSSDGGGEGREPLLKVIHIEELQQTVDSMVKQAMEKSGTRPTPPDGDRVAAGGMVATAPPCKWDN